MRLMAMHELATLLPVIDGATAHQYLSSADLTEKIAIVGVLAVNATGIVVLHDATGEVPVFLNGGDKAPDKAFFGHIWAFTQFHLVMEPPGFIYMLFLD
jgi:hypothetical protein